MMAVRWFLCVLSLVGVGVAVAAQPDVPVAPGDVPAVPASEDDPNPPELVSLPPSFREDWWWVPMGPRRGIKFSDVALHPSEPSVYAAVTLDGAVWLTLDGGKSWVDLLSPVGMVDHGPLQEEESLMRVETAIQDALNNVGIEDAGDLSEDDPEYYAEDDYADQIASDLQDAQDEVIGSLQDDSWVVDQGEVLSGRLDAARPRVWFSQEGWLFVGRVDGLYLSKNLQEFKRVIDEPVTALAYLSSRKLWVAGTGDGVRFATDGVSWIDAEDGTERLHIFELSAGEEGVYAGTSSGLWFAPDAQSWRPVRGVKDPIVALQVDPAWERGLWFSTPDNTWRSDAGGERPRANLGAPLRGVVEFVLIGPGHLLASTADGPWESLDGGTTWVPLSRGLTDPDCRGLAVRKGVLLLATDEGLFRLEPAHAQGEQVSRATSPHPGDFVRRTELLDAALSRDGLSIHRAPKRWMSTLAPRLDLQLDYYPHTSLGWSNGALNSNPGTTQTDDRVVRAFSKLTWVPAGRKTTSTTVWAIPNADGSGVFLDDSDSYQVMVTRVSRGSSQYRSQLSTNINHLYFARGELLSARAGLTQGSVLDQVEHELRILEIEATLDALTDGAVARWAASQGLSQEP